MGYTTNFTGVLRFVDPPSEQTLARIRAMRHEDLRDHPEWRALLGPSCSAWYHFDLQVTSDGAGVEWTGSEKTYGMADQVRLLLLLFPSLRLEGALQAQGEEVGDVWFLRCVPGKDPEMVRGLLPAAATPTFADAGASEADLRSALTEAVRALRSWEDEWQKRSGFPAVGLNFAGARLAGKDAIRRALPLCPEIR